MSSKPDTPGVLALRERMQRACALTGCSSESFLQHELRVAAGLQAYSTASLVTAGHELEAAATALLQELSPDAGSAPPFGSTN